MFGSKNFAQKLRNLVLWVEITKKVHIDKSPIAHGFPYVGLSRFRTKKDESK